MSHRKAPDDCDEETSYSAEAMEGERQRCYALGVAAERERILAALPGGHSVDPQWVADLVRGQA